MDLKANHDEVLSRIGAAAGRSERAAASVTCVAVGKTFPADVIVRAAEAGLKDLGESRAQELKEKYAVLGDRVRWHFVGHLQTNKVRYVAGIATLIHSVDRYGVAEAIARRARSVGKTQQVLVEVNVARESAKHGADPAQAIALAQEVDELEGIEVKGLMTMAPFSEDPEEARPYFRELADLSQVLIAQLPGAAELSMGMTRDFEVAVEEGATIVRVGEAIFGPRHRSL
ncbi:MAG TPA: YggS family pyridoxal phosphate-dependent enzyme [Actinomycetota bacterium]|nr:YggS family pyridoxal phosphate-dependent enzyme [Actinomycetota bacterium]